MATKYIINLTVTKVFEVTVPASQPTRYDSNAVPEKTIKESTELTKIVQTASSMSQVKSIALGLIDLIPEEE
jgi:uncharacterized membrane protein